MALRRKTNNNAGNGLELDALRATRQDLAGRLAAAEAQAAALDPLEDWERLSALATEAQALERALATADARIVEAERLAVAMAREEREQAQAQRRIDALQNVMTVSAQVAEQAQQWRAGILADLQAAAHELAMTGGVPAMAVAQALHITKAVDEAMNGWRTYAPEWVGLPTPPTREELALAERRQRVSEAEARLENARKQAKEDRGRFGSSGNWAAVLETHAHGLAGTRRQLLALEEPDLSPDEVFARTTAGLERELENHIGRYWEARRMEKAKQQREAEAMAQ